MAIFKPKPVAPTPVRGKPVTPKPVAPTPVAPKPVIGKPVAPRPVAPKPVIGKPVMPGIKPLPPGSPMPVAPKLFYGNDQPDMGGHSSFYNSLMGGGAAPSKPVMGNNIGTSGFKNIAPANFQTGLSNDMKKGGKVSSASKRADGIAQRGKTRA